MREIWHCQTHERRQMRVWSSAVAVTLGGGLRLTVEDPWDKETQDSPTTRE